MNDRLLVDALRGRDPTGLAALYDAHAEGIYKYCWSLLGGPDGAQVALRDTLIVAQARAHALGDPRQLRVWLYALARGECQRRRHTAPDGQEPQSATAESPAVRPAATSGRESPADAALRAVAWDSVRRLPPDEREILELTTRHTFAIGEAARILGLSPRRARLRLQSATAHLTSAVTTQIAARKSAHDYPDPGPRPTDHPGHPERPDHERPGHPEWRDRPGHPVGSEHVGYREHPERSDHERSGHPEGSGWGGYRECREHSGRSRQVSAERVFRMLPEPGLPTTLRVRVTSCLTDPDLAPYREYVARRVGPLDGAGFPAGGSQRWALAAAGALAAVAAVTLVALLFGELRGVGGRTGVTSDASAAPAAEEPPGVRMLWNSGGTPMLLRPILRDNGTPGAGRSETPAPGTPGSGASAPAGGGTAPPSAARSGPPVPVGGPERASRGPSGGVPGAATHPVPRPAPAPLSGEPGRVRPSPKAQPRPGPVGGGLRRGGPPKWLRGRPHGPGGHPGPSPSTRPSTGPATGSSTGSSAARLARLARPRFRPVRPRVRPMAGPAAPAAGRSAGRAGLRRPYRRGGDRRWRWVTISLGEAWRGGHITR